MPEHPSGMKSKDRSAEEWEGIEREEHDREYRDSLPFDFKSYRIDPQQVIWWEDYCYLPGRRKDRGHRTKRFFELVDLSTVKGKTIIDVGCGNGQYSVFFALLGATVYGCDISPVGIKAAKRMAEENGVSEHCHFSVQNIAHTDYADEQFDIVLFHETLHHAIKYPGVKEETLRILKPRGKVVCTEGLANNFIFRLGTLFTMHGKEAKGDMQLKLADFEEFSRGFSEQRIETMSFLFMSKRFFQNYLHIPLVRWFLKLLKRTDDTLLHALPSLCGYCGEIVLVLHK